MTTKFLVVLLFLILFLNSCRLVRVDDSINENFFANFSNMLIFGNDKQFPEVSQVEYQQSQLWKIHTKNVKHKLIKVLQTIGGEIWNVNMDGVDMFLRAHVAQAAKELIDKSDITYNIMIDDIQKVIDENSQSSSQMDVPGGTILQQTGMTWEQYHSLSDIDEFLHTMSDYFPKITNIMTAGRSVERRHIKVLRISNGRESNPAIFICGGIQGRDWIGPAAITYAMYNLARYWRDHLDYVRKIDWYFLPMLNPDGYEYSQTVDRLWNKNRKYGGECQGVNIDRNFGFSWSKKGSSGDTCSTLYRGPDKFSEPETKALRKAIKNIAPKLAAYITVGGYGQLITYPWGDGNFIPGNAKEMHRVAKLMIKNIRKAVRSEYRTGSSFRLQLPSAGNSADWVYKTTNAEYVYNLLLRDQGRYGFLLPPNFIKESGEEVFEILQTIAEVIS